jgi:hypothetical protein
MIKKCFLGVILIFAGNTIIASRTTDSTEFRNSRFGFGVIPAFSFDADIGLKYGAIFNFFDYGKPTKTSGYLQYLYLRITNTTRGTFNFQSVYESETAVKNARLTAEMSYLSDRKMDFFGFNGAQARFHKGLINAGSNDFINNFYYAHRRQLLRLRLDIQKYLLTQKLRLLTGFTYQKYHISEADAEDEREPQQSGAAEKSTLFEQYKQWGIIPLKDQTGGNINLLTIGLVYDTRNHLCYCTNGQWIESFLVISPGFLSDASFSKFVAAYRRHQSFWDEKVTISLRASLQQKLSGEIPFYALPVFYDSRLSQDGVGGAFNLRGAMRNRIAADGFALSNLEIKLKLFETTALKQHFYFSFSAFWDMAFVTQNYHTDFSKVPEEYYDFYFNDMNQKPHHTFGPGFYIVFNKDNIITVNYGLPFDPQDGPGGLYVGSALLF